MATPVGSIPSPVNFPPSRALVALWRALIASVAADDSAGIGSLWAIWGGRLKNDALGLRWARFDWRHGIKRRAFWGLCVASGVYVMRRHTVESLTERIATEKLKQNPSRAKLTRWVKQIQQLEGPIWDPALASGSRWSGEASNLQGHHEQHAAALVDCDGFSTLVPIAQFDFDAVDRNLGFHEPEQSEVGTVSRWSPEMVATMADGLGDLLRWFATAGTVEAAGLRAIMLTFTLRPELFAEKSVSVLAARIGCTKQALYKYSAEIFRLANGIAVGRITPQGSPEGRARRAEITRAHHVAVGHTISNEPHEPKRKMSLRRAPRVYAGL